MIKYFELNNNENITYWNIYSTDKAVFKGKTLALNVYTRRRKGDNLWSKLLFQGARKRTAN